MVSLNPLKRPPLRHRFLRPALVVLCSLGLCAVAAEVRGQVAPDQVFVSADWARENADVWVDARDGVSYALSHHPQAVHLPWTTFTVATSSGQLLESNELARLLGDAGIDDDSTVVVYGDWVRGWGEEGHFFWMLEYLGHEDVHILDGGWNAWVQDAGEASPVVVEPTPVQFAVDLRPELLAAREQVVALADGSEPGLLLDVRTDEEFRGGRLHGESRGGHIPRAEHADWRTFVTSASAAAPVSAMEVGPASPIVTYCTGGVRSGFAYAALRAAGFTRVSNYAPSFWEWSADPALPLVSEAE